MPHSLLQQRGRAFVFDEQAVMAANADDLDHEALKRRFGQTATLLSELLRNTRVVVHDEDGVDRPTVAGLLAFGESPQTHLPSACIAAAVYRGSGLHSDDLVHSDRIESTVDRQIDDAVAFVKRFMLKPARKDVGRKDFFRNMPWEPCMRPL